MRKLLTLALLLAATVVQAKPIGLEAARQSASAFLAKRRHNAPATAPAATTVQYLSSQPSSGQPYYIFNIGQDAGFVIVSGDDRARTILGYTDHGHFDADNAPANMLAWLDDCARQIEELKQTECLQKKAAAQWGGGRPVRVMLQTKWGQTAPYNQMCPIYTDGNLSVAGCVAVAMAQVMNYHRWPTAPLSTTIPGGYNTYDPFVAGYGMAAGTSFKWSLMRDSYDPRQSYSDGSEQAVAQLMAACGSAVETGYASWGSGSSLAWVVKALTTYFDYATRISYVEKRNYTTDSWYELIYKELANGRPVLYGGMSSETGHVFVLDGYDGGGLFHINWGWAGLSDGFFSLSALDPEDTGLSDGFNMNQHAVIGVWPNDASRPFTDNTDEQVQSGNLELTGYDLPRGDAVTEREVELVCHVRNNGYNTFTGQVYLMDGNELMLPTDYNPYEGITITPGGTRDVTFKFIPETTGTKLFTLCADISQQNGRIAEIRLEIGRNQSAPLTDVVFQTIVYAYNMGDNHIHGTKIKGYFVVKNFNTMLDYDGDASMVWYAYNADENYFRSFHVIDYHIHVPAGEECNFDFAIPSLPQNTYMPFIRVNGVNQTNGWDDICYLDGIPNDINDAGSMIQETRDTADGIFDLTGRRVADKADAALRPGIYVIGGRKVFIQRKK